MASTDELREIERLTSSIGRMMDGLADTSDRRNRALEREANTMKSIVSSIQSEEDISRSLESLERRKTSILKTNYGVNQSMKNDLLRMNQIAIDSLKTEQTRLQVLQKVKQAAEDAGDGLKEGLSSIQSSIAEIPVLGGVLNKLIPSSAINKQIDNMTAGFTRGFSTMFNRNLSQGKGFVKSFSAGTTAGLGQLGKAIGPLLTNPYTLAALAILAVVAVGVLGFYKIAAAAKAFRTETGLLNSQTKGLEENIMAVSKNSSRLGVSMDDVSKAASEFSREFGNIEQASESVLTSMVTMNANFGVGVEEGVKLNKIFQNIGGLTATQSQFLIGQTISMAKLANVAPQQVIKDMAENSELAYKYFSGSPEELAKAAVQAAKLGTSIGEAGKVADNLLDFENSITAELEASAILGQSLNFGRARYLASTGDILGAQQAVNDQVAKLGDITNLNTFQQEALAKATGMSYESLVNQQRIRERFGNLDKEQLAAAMSFIDAGQDLTKISQKDLELQTKKLAEQQEMQSQFDSMGNSLKAVGMDILTALAPIGKVFVGIVMMFGSLLKGFIGPVGNAINGILDALAPIGSMLKDIFGDGAGIGDVFEFIGKIVSGPLVFAINVFSSGLKMVAAFVSGIYNVFKGILTGDFSLILDGLLSIGEGVLRFFYAIPMVLLDTFLDMFPSIGEAFESLASKIKGFFIDMLPGWAVKLIGGNDMGQSAKQSESMSSFAGDSVNDGVIQNGQVVSTHPDDFLIATKNPAGLAESMSGGGSMISMEGVIKELRELKAAFLSNKDVYMDSTKVTTIVRRKTETSTDNKFGTQFA